MDMAKKKSARKKYLKDDKNKKISAFRQVNY